MGIEALSRVVRINASYAHEHQLAVIDCLEDPDETLKGKTLELLFKMTSPNNVEVRYASPLNDKKALFHFHLFMLRLAHKIPCDCTWAITRRRA